jgi:ribosomal protein L11
MVDRGFTVSENLPPCVNLIMPSFKHKNKSQFTTEEVKRNKKISEARVHIERAIRRIKQFEIFSKEMKMTQKEIYENMFKTCGYLVNFQDPFLKVT